MMRSLTLALATVLIVVALSPVRAAEPTRTIAGTFDILICSGPCSFEKPANVLSKGTIVLFAKQLERADLRRFDENRFLHHHGEPINGCFTLDTGGTASTYAGIEKVGLTSWSEQRGQYHFSLFHSPDAGYQVSVEPTKTGLAGKGVSWGAGAAAPAHPATDIVLARRTGPANISHCAFETPEEHVLRKLLADPARSEIFAIEEAYEQRLSLQLQASTLARDWAMAGWIRHSEEGDDQILRSDRR